MYFAIYIAYIVVDTFTLVSRMDKSRYCFSQRFYGTKCAFGNRTIIFVTQIAVNAKIEK